MSHTPIVDPAAIAERIRLARTRNRRRRILLRWMLASAASTVAIVLLRHQSGSLYAVFVALIAIQLLAIVFWRRSHVDDGLQLGTPAVDERVPEAPEPVLDEYELAVQRNLARAAKTLRYCYRASGWVTVLCLAGAIGGTCLLTMVGFEMPILAGIVCVPGGMLLLRALEMRGNQAAYDVARQIRTASTEAAGAIIDFMQASDLRYHERALDSLERLLRRMRPANASSLTPDRRRYLYGMLRPAQARLRPSTALAVMEMIEQLGDRAAEPYLQALLAMPDPRAEQDKALLRAAHFALQSLEEVDASLARRGTLLSPASAPGEPVEMLLRPRGSSAGLPPEQLLRTAEPGTGDTMGDES